MRFLVLASDYDGTLAHDGRVDAPTLAAVERCRASGRKVVLVTGRELDDLHNTFDRVDVFDLVVAENGALLYWPATREERPLAPAPPNEFCDALRARGVPLSCGRVIVATWVPHEKAVLETIHQLGLELQVIFNKGAVMVLPSGVNKATGLAAALTQLHLSPHNVVTVGDAENDHALLASCEAGVAVSNALPLLKEHADWVTKADHGAGVTELIDMLTTDDAAAVQQNLTRHRIRLGEFESHEEFALEPYGHRVLVAGSSGSGKSTLTTALLERLAEAKYQFCVVDPEGDYDQFELAVSIGNRAQPPAVDQLIKMLEDPTNNAVAILVGVPLADRPTVFLALLTQLLELRARLGHPHWIVVNEAHQVLPASWKPEQNLLMRQLDRCWFVALRPDAVSAAVLQEIDTAIGVGAKAAELVQEFAHCIGAESPTVSARELASDEVLVCKRNDIGAAAIARVEPRHAQPRH